MKIKLLPNEPRASYLLRVAAKYIDSFDSESLITYDEAECDGACLAGDCDIEAENIRDEIPNEQIKEIMDILQPFTLIYTMEPQTPAEDKGDYYSISGDLIRDIQTLLNKYKK